MLEAGDTNRAMTSPNKRTVVRLIAENAAKLKINGIDSPENEIEMILCHLLDINRLNLYLHGDSLIDHKVIKRLNQIVEKRTTRYPLQYILGEHWFYGRRYFINESVMVPAPETELLCEGALTFLKSNNIKSPRILDIGTGSGVIAVTLAAELESCHVLALDISDEALEVAGQNATAHKAGKKIEFRNSNLLDNVGNSEKFDLIISNPPYVTESEYKNLAPEVLADPKIAITSGEDGLDVIRKILEQAPDYLKPNGRIMFEIGYNQAETITIITEKDNRCRSISILKDLNEFDRIVILTCSD